MQRYKKDLDNNRVKIQTRYLKNFQYKRDRQKVNCDRK